MSANARKVIGSLFLASILHHDFPSSSIELLFFVLKHKNCSAGKIMSRRNEMKADSNGMYFKIVKVLLTAFFCG